MQISLTPELERLIEDRVNRGDYDTPVSLIEEAVHRLIEEDEGDTETIRGILQFRDGEIDSGNALEFDENSTGRLATDIHRRGLRRLIR